MYLHSILTSYVTEIPNVNFFTSSKNDAKNYLRSWKYFSAYNLTTEMKDIKVHWIDLVMLN